MFLPLKAWFEINGVLASILDLIEKNLSPKELDEKLKPFALGNKGKSKVGQIEATNVLTMIEKADKYMTKIIKENNSPTETFFSYFYDIASNPSHPSFDAQEMVGSLMDEGVWTAKSPEEIKNSITIDIDNYGGLLMSPLFIKNICENIFTIEKDNFAKLKSKKYFN